MIVSVCYLVMKLVYMGFVFVYGLLYVLVIQLIF